MKFSIIIPVLNVEPYLKKCLDSVVNQTYKNFEALVICDKSTDKSNDIVDKYIKKDKRFIKVYEENAGLARAKNLGVKKSSGDYIIFLDGDDFLELDLLETLCTEKVDKYDVVRYQAREVFTDDSKVDYNEEAFKDLDGIDAFNMILRYHYIENSWLYAYNAKYYKDNKYKFAEGCIAEDYGLTPLIIANAKKVNSISYIGYNYVQRDNSLMNSKDYSKRLKKMDDMLTQSDDLKHELKSIKSSDRIISFLNNSLIYYSSTLNYKDFKKYNKILKEKDCYKYVKGDSFRSKIRCFLIKTNAYVFFRYINRG